MLPFVFLFLVPIVVQHIDIKGINYQKKNGIALTFFFVLLTLLVMFRHTSVGSDTINYINHFSVYSKIDWTEIGNQIHEIGYVFSIRLISSIFNNYRFFFVLAALAVSAMIYPTYIRLCRDTSLTIILFGFMSTFVLMFSGIRQMLTIAIGFIAYEFARQKRLVPFMVVVLIAMSFHISAFMIAFMYPLYHARITKKWLYGVITALILVFVFNKQIFSILSIILARNERYNFVTTSTGAYATLVLFIVFGAFSFLIPDEDYLDDETIGQRNFLLLAIVIQMFAPLHSLAMRMNYYYIVFIPLLIPKIIQNRSEKWGQVAVIGRHIMVVFFLIYFFVNAYTSTSNLHVFPYRFFWE